MVTRKNVHALMKLAHGLSYIRLSCVNASIGAGVCPVNGSGYILSSLVRTEPIMKSLSLQHESLKEIYPQLQAQIKHIKKNYPESKVNTDEDNISKKDADSLQKECVIWRDKIYAVYSTDGTVLLTDSLLEDFIPSNIYKKLDKFEKGDLDDGINALQHLLPTPAATTLFRVAERAIQKYYKKITGKESGRKTWGQMISDLEKNPKTRKPLLGYLYFLNEKRIDSSHPYRRYSQEEGERILLNLKDLLEEIYLKKSRK